MIGAITTKTDYVYQQIRREILDGRLTPNQRLPLGELARRYEVSEMPVREALRMLQRDGLVHLHSHRGVTVTHLSWERAMEFIEVRTHLELLAARLALPHHTADSVAGLRQLIDRMRPLAEQGGTNTRYSQLNRDFHHALYLPGPNSVVKREIEELWDQVWRARAQSIFEIDPERVRGATREHERIVDAVEQGDAAELDAAMDDHRTRTLTSWRAIALDAKADMESKHHGFSD